MRRAWCALRRDGVLWLCKNIPRSALASVPAAAVAVSVHGVFAGGRTADDALETARWNVSWANVRAGLDESCEDARTREEAERNAQKKELLVRRAAEQPHLTPFVALKTSALGVDSETVERAIKKLAKCAAEGGVTLLVDAERSDRQQSVRSLCLELLRSSEKRKPPVVLNTYQMYLKDGLRQLEEDLESSARHEFPMGVKLVRGAYLTSDSRSLIHDCKENTDEAYNCAIDMVLHHLSRRGAEMKVLFATHNLESVKFAIDRMEALNFSTADERIWFGQILGLGRASSVFASDSGCNVMNLLVFGEPSDLSGWLLRRIDELRFMHCK